MERLITSDDFTDLADVYVSSKDQIAILKILIPYSKKKGSDTQEDYQILNRFAEGAQFGQKYYALYLPFTGDEIKDTRLTEKMESITSPIMDGPFHLGLSGPAKHFSRKNTTKNNPDPTNGNAS